MDKNLNLVKSLRDIPLANGVIERKKAEVVRKAEQMMDKFVDSLVREGRADPGKVGSFRSSTALRDQLQKEVGRLEVRKLEERRTAKKYDNIAPRYLLPKGSMTINSAKSKTGPTSMGKGLKGSTSKGKVRPTSASVNPSKVRISTPGIEIGKALEKKKSKIKKKVNKSKPEVAPGTALTPPDSILDISKPQTPNLALPYPSHTSKPLAKPHILGPADVKSIASRKTPGLLQQFKHLNTVTIGSPNQFRASLDLSGFYDNEASVQLEGRRLIVTAKRPKRRDLNARKVTEIIDIPPGVDMNCLQIGRNSDGILIIQEVRQDFDNNLI